MYINHLERRSIMTIFDLESDDNRFISQITDNNNRELEILKMVKERRNYLIVFIISVIIIILSLFTSFNKAFAIGFSAFAYSCFVSVDMKVKIFKAFRK